MPENTTPMQPRPGTRPQPRSLFVFDLRELGRRAGTLREYRRRVPAPAGFGLELLRVPEGAPLDLDLRLESVTEGVLVTGTVSGPLTGQCGRCLEPVSEEIAVDIVELFAYANSVTVETTEEDEVHRVDGDLLDVEPVVRDAIVLALPWTPLCRPDCAGLCPDCGQRLDDLPADHGHVQLDPRWAALAGLATVDDTADDPARPSSASDRPTSKE
jgi:DUF177 domain-containing protein